MKASILFELFALGSTMRIMFGSCNHQSRDQSIYNTMSLYKPDAYFWTGDIVYPRCSDLTCVEKAYDAQYKRTEYKEFSQEIPLIDGVYDDHDFGENDGGSSYKFKIESKNLMLEFLNVSDSDPRRARLGAYHSLNLYEKGLSAKSGRNVKIIFLDTRYFRDPHYFYSESPYLGRSLLRMAAGYLGFGWDYDGSFLGEDQWVWFEQELEDSKRQQSESVIIVSSVQVFTTFPLFESWGHFPRERQRLFKLLQKVKPPGVIFVSGDVHFGELSGNPSKGGVLEVTSSGLTHSTGSLGRIFEALSWVALHRPFGNEARLENDDPMLKQENDKSVEYWDNEKKSWTQGAGIRNSASAMISKMNFAVFDINFLSKKDEKMNKNSEGKTITIDINIISNDNSIVIGSFLEFNEHDNWEQKYLTLDSMPDVMRKPWSLECIFWWTALIFGTLFSIAFNCCLLWICCGKRVWNSEFVTGWRRQHVNKLSPIPQSEAGVSKISRTGIIRNNNK